MSKEFKEGDYVLATRWSDGDPQDPWCIGFYVEAADRDKHLIYWISDSDSIINEICRRVAHITQDEGRYLLDNRDLINISSYGLYKWLRDYRKLLNKS